MLLKCAGTGSKGNSYALIADNGEALLIECGVKWSEIMKMIEQFENQSAEKLVSPDILTDTWIEILISIKNQLTKTYQDRAFMVLRHQNLWALHQIRTQKKLFIKM